MEVDPEVLRLRRPSGQGTFGIAGDWAGGATGGFLGGLIPGFEPVTVPAGAIAGSYYGGEWMKSLGAKVAIPFCK